MFNFVSPVVAAARPIVLGIGLTGMQHVQVLLFSGASAALVYQAGKASNAAIELAVTKTGGAIATGYNKLRARRKAAQVELDAEIERQIASGVLFRAIPA
jgi:hypothetical protein